MSQKHKLQRDARTGVYFARIQVDGVRKRFALGKFRDEARSELRRIEREVRQGNISFEEQAQKPRSAVSGEKVMLSDLVSLYMEWSKENRAEGTWRLYDSYLHQFLSFHGNHPVSSITRFDIERFYTWAKKNGGRGPNAGNMQLRHVKTALLWAEDMDLCPCPVRKFPRASETPPETIRFNDEEMRKFIAAIPDPDFRDMVIFGFLTGLRPQELRGLRKEHVKQDDEGNVYLYIERHKTAKTTRQPKPRSVPLVPEAADIARRLIAKHKKCPYVFVNGNGALPYKANVLRQRFRRACKRAGIKPRPPYSMRHTFGSMQAEANINQACLSHLMGHSQIRTTSRYVTPTDEYHRSAVALIKGRILNAASGEEDEASVPDETQKDHDES